MKLSFFVVIFDGLCYYKPIEAIQLLNKNKVGLMKINQAKHILNTLSKEIYAEVHIVAYMENCDAEAIISGPKSALISTIAKGEEYIRSANSAYNPLDEAKVGDGLTYGYGSDREAYTIVRKTDKVIVATMDKATLLNGGDLVFDVGGFSAHCLNQDIQEYQYESDPEGVKVTFRRRKNGKWLPAGQPLKKTGAYTGRRKFHDYNF